MQLNRLADLVLRAGVAFAFLYPAIDAFLDPYTWIGYFPGFVRGFVPDMVMLHSFGTLEILIALWILSGKKILVPSLAVTAILAAIILLNLQDFQIIFRDVTIAAAALSLVLMRASYSRMQTVTTPY